MKTLQEKIAVMQAAAEGKKIQVYYMGRWDDAVESGWNWMAFDYRVKPEPAPKKYRPYETTDEFKSILGKTIVATDGEHIGIVTGIRWFEGAVYAEVGHNIVRLNKLVDEYTIDGSPCGVEEGGDL